MLNKIEFGTMARRDTDKQLVYIAGAARFVDGPGREAVIFAAIDNETGFVKETLVQDKADFMKIFSKV